MRQEGVVPTVRSVLNRLDEPMPLGYAWFGDYAWSDWNTRPNGCLRNLAAAC